MKFATAQSNLHLQARQDYLGVEDIQLRLTPLEDVFLAVTRKAELENAQVRT